MLDEIKTRAAKARRTGINVYSHADVQWLIDRVEDLEAGVAAGQRAAQSARELVETLLEIERIAEAPVAGGPLDAVRWLKDWQAGANGAATIAYPPRVGPHTEAAYCAHRAEYTGGSEGYRVGADMVAAAVLAAKESWMTALPAHDPLTCMCCQGGRP